MAGFTDGAGRRWTFRVTVGALGRCQRATGLNALDVLMPDSATAQELRANPFRVADVAYHLLEDAAGASPEAFADALDGESLEELTRALLDAIVEFYPEKKRRPLAEALRRLRGMEIRAQAAAEARLEEALAQAETSFSPSAGA